MANERFIPLSLPNICGNEWRYVKECLDSGWISSVGSYVDKFEGAVANYVGAKYAVATVNGTAALHVALQLCGVKHDDFVIVPNITFVATANAVRYAGAEPILVDADLETWQMDLDLLESFLDTQTAFNDAGECIHKPTGRCIRVLMPVHVQGNIGDMQRLLDLAAKHGLTVVEDAAESLGSTYHGKHGGTFGLVGCCSFNGNKIISTGGGGVILTNDPQLAKRAKHLTTTAKTDPVEYFHDEVGYNYRLVNILAAVGVAQMENLSLFVKKKQEIGSFYRKHLTGVADIGFQTVRDGVEHNNWLFTIQTKHQRKIIEHLNGNKILCRPFWAPMRSLPMYKDCLYVTERDNCDTIHKTCLAIPCSTSITEPEMQIVVDEIKEAVV
jgi:perosamine synthetase